MDVTTPPVGEHLRHMTDGRWHDDCSYCLRRRVKGGTGVPEDELATYEKSRTADGILARYNADEAFRARITEMYLNDRLRFLSALISLAYSLGATRPEAVEFANVVTRRVKAAMEADR